MLTILKGQHNVPPARLAHHADGAQSARDVLEFAPVAAAKAAAVGAHREAAALYALTLRYADALVPPARARLLDDLSFESYLIEQTEGAIAARSAALEIWRAAGEGLKEGDALRWLSRLNWFMGRGAEALKYSADAIAVLAKLPPGPELAMAYSNQAQLDMLADQQQATLEWAGRAIKLAEPAGYDDVLCHALTSYGAARLASGDTGGWSDLQRALSIARAHDFQDHAARAYANHIYAALWSRDYAATRRFLAEALAYCAERDLDAYSHYFVASRARVLFEQGEWDEASRDAEAAIHHPRTAPVTRITALTVIANLRIRRGDPDPMTPLSEAEALAHGTEELQRLGPLAIARANAAWIAGIAAQIIEHVRPAYELAHRRGDLWVKGELAIWMWRAGALEEPPTEVAEPYTLEMTGEARAAGAAWSALGCPYECALALASSNEEKDLIEALRLLEQLGADAAANALRRRMHQCGVRIPRGARESTRAHAHGLTRRESEILALMAEGLRNSSIAERLFLSTRTVDHHVSAILAKLGASTRAEAVALGMRGKKDERRQIK